MSDDSQYVYIKKLTQLWFLWHNGLLGLMAQQFWVRFAISIILMNNEELPEVKIICKVTSDK